MFPEQGLLNIQQPFIKQSLKRSFVQQEKSGKQQEAGVHTSDDDRRKPRGVLAVLRQAQQKNQRRLQLPRVLR